MNNSPRLRLNKWKNLPPLAAHWLGRYRYPYIFQFCAYVTGLGYYLWAKWQVGTCLLHFVSLISDWPDMTQAVWQNQHIKFRYRNETAVQRCNPQRRSPFRQFAAPSKYLHWKECKCGEITTGGAQQINTFRYPNLDFSSPLSGSVANISALLGPLIFFSDLHITTRCRGSPARISTL
jgi:hypothetical protein